MGTHTLICLTFRIAEKYFASIRTSQQENVTRENNQSRTSKQQQQQQQASKPIQAAQERSNNPDSGLIIDSTRD